MLNTVQYNTDVIGLIIFVGLLLFSVTIVIIYVLTKVTYLRTYKIKVFVFNFTERGFTTKLAGRTKEMVNQQGKELYIKRKPFKRGFYYTFDNTLMHVIVDLVRIRRRDICLFGAVARNDQNNVIFTKENGYRKYSFKNTITKDNANVIFETRDLLKTLNELIKPQLSDELVRLKQVGKATLGLAKDINNAKDDFVRAVGMMSRGINDASKIIAEIFGLRPDEVNADRIQELVLNAETKEIQRQVRSGEITVNKPTELTEGTFSKLFKKKKK